MCGLCVDAFVNSQEWTLSKQVSELRLGVLGALNSGKSSLVHRYLTGTYIPEESPEGGRFKKEVFLEGGCASGAGSGGGASASTQTQTQSFLLLIRDEAGLPDVQVWITFLVNLQLEF